MVQNKGLIYKQIPSGVPEEGKDIAVEVREFDLDAAPPQGGVTTKNFYLSYDPYQRGRMRDPSVKSYSPAYTAGSTINNSGIGRVLKSDSEKVKEGDLVIGFLGIEEYSSLSKQVVDMPIFRKLENPQNLNVVEYLGPLGMPGITAYSSLYEIGKPQSGETIFISSAAGAVGQYVGQIAKHEGLTVIGSVGSDEKLQFITKDLGFDAGFNYKKEKPEDALARLAPHGIDIYYENVGGDHLDAALAAMKDFGRIVACGMVSQYNKKPEDRYRIKNIGYVVSKRLTIRGFIQSDKNMAPVYWKDHQENVGKWLADGSFKSKLYTTEGIDNAAKGFLGMLEGKNFGKAVLKIADIE